MKKFSLALAILLIASSIMAGTAHAQSTEPLKIGLMVDQSGPLTIYGHEEENGFKLGLLYEAGVDPSQYNNDVNEALKNVKIAGRAVEVVMRDNASNADTAATQARELIEQEGVEILVGSPSSGVMTGVQQIAKDSDVILFVDPAASPAITGANFNVNTFRVCRNTFQDFLAFAPYAKANIGSKFVILAIDNDFGKASATAAQGVLGAAGIEFLSDPIFVPLSTTDFTPYIQQVLNSGANALLPIWAGDSSVTLFQQLAELGVQEKMAVVAAFNSNDIVKLSDKSTIGTQSWIVYHYSFPKNAVNDWMVEKHKAAFNDVPDLFTECSFATGQALVKAVTATKGDTTPSAMIPALEGMIFNGPKGTYGIRPSDHQALVPMYIAKLVNLDDPDQKYYELLAEVPASDIVPPILLAADVAAERTKLDEGFLDKLKMASSEASPTMEATPAK